MSAKPVVPEPLSEMSFEEIVDTWIGSQAHQVDEIEASGHAAGPEQVEAAEEYIEKLTMFLKSKEKLTEEDQEQLAQLIQVNETRKRHSLCNGEASDVSGQPHRQADRAPQPAEDVHSVSGSPHDLIPQASASPTIPPNPKKQQGEFPFHFSSSVI